jgi:hypothetical protein
MQKAKGEYIKILHHDEWFVDDYALLKFVKAAESDSKSLVISESYLIREGKTKIFKATEEQIDLIKNQPQRLILANLFGSPSSSFFHKDHLKAFDKELIWLVDVEFYVDFLLKNKKLVYLKEPLYCSVMDEHNITNSCLYDCELQLKEYVYLYKKYVKNLSLRINYLYFIAIFKILLNTNPKNKKILFLRLLKKVLFK